jgi:hypothetical protein
MRDSLYIPSSLKAIDSYGEQHEAFRTFNKNS